MHRSASGLGKHIMSDSEAGESEQKSAVHEDVTKGLSTGTFVLHLRHGRIRMRAKMIDDDEFLVF